MDGFRIPLGSWVEAGVDWVKVNLDGLLDVVSFVVTFLVDGLTSLLLLPYFFVVIAIAALIAWLVRSWQLAIGTVVSFTLIVAMGLWVPAMQTLGLVLVAALVAVVIAVPLGIWSARNATVRAVLKPVLDFMQTMPAFVYLIPAIVFFSIGVVPGLVATVIFALPPGVRLTELGIRGSTPRPSRPTRPSARSRGRSCAASSFRSRCRRSSPASTRSSCSPCPWRSSPEWREQTASGRWSSKPSRP